MVTNINETLIRKYKKEIDESTKHWEELCEESVETYSYIIKLKKWLKELEEEVSTI
jgi:hypothetical protein